MISDHADPLAEIGSKEAGGQNIYVLYLAKFLCRIGIYVDVYTRWDRKNKKEVVKMNNFVRIIRVKAGPKRHIPRDDFLNVVDEFSDNVIKRIYKENQKYDIIHSNYWYSGIIGLKIAKIIKLPMVHVYHSIGKVRFDTLKNFKLHEGDNVFFQKRIEIEKKIAHDSTAIVSTSPVEKGILKKIFDIPGDKIKVIPIGVDTDVFRPIKRKSKKHNNGKYILYVGRIEWRKGLGTLIYAFREILSDYPGMKLKIIGGGKSSTAKKLEEAEGDRLKKIARNLNIVDNISFVGSKKQKNLYRFYSLAEVCVVPSYYEPFGIVPLESMACGTPVVASKTGGLQFTVEDNVVGKLAKPRDYKDLAKKIRAVLKKGKKHYQKNCLERVRKYFRWENIVNLYEEYFNQLINLKK